MEDIATSTIVAVVETKSFWEYIPAAAYVLIGVIISGLFSYFSTVLNIRNSKKLKKLENENSRKLKKLEIENNREVQVLEIEHKEKLQEQKEKADKFLRLLDRKLKIFSDFHKNYSEIIVSGTEKERHRRIEILRKSIYEVRLLASSISTDLDDLDDELLAFGNFYLEIMQNKITLEVEDKGKQVASHFSRINPLVSKIFSKMADEM